MIFSLQSSICGHAREPAEDQVFVSQKVAAVIPISSNLLLNDWPGWPASCGKTLYHLTRTDGTSPFDISELSHKVIELADHIYLQGTERRFVRWNGDSR